jgi:hypothetical protein
LLLLARTLLTTPSPGENVDAMVMVVVALVPVPTPARGGTLFTPTPPESK